MAGDDGNEFQSSPVRVDRRNAAYKMMKETRHVSILAGPGGPAQRRRQLAVPPGRPVSILAGPGGPAQPPPGSTCGTRSGFQSSPVRVNRRNHERGGHRARATGFNPRRSGWTGATSSRSTADSPIWSFNPRRSGWTGATSDREAPPSPSGSFNPRRSGWTGATTASRGVRPIPEAFQSSPVRVDRRNRLLDAVEWLGKKFQSSPVRVDRRNATCGIGSGSPACFNPRRSGWTGATPILEAKNA